MNAHPRLSVAAIAVLAATLLIPPPAKPCTTVLIGKSLTADGSVIHAHNEDMGNEAAGRLWAVAPTSHRPGETLSVPYVELPRAESTHGYWASGNAQGAAGLGVSEKIRPYDSVLVGLNRQGVSMSCNWAYSREENRQGTGIRRYAIRQLLLERARSARHGVEIIGDLIDEYGQADWGGLIYHLADPHEAWVVETTTRNWVARRVRDDEIRVTANRFRIGSDFDLSSETLLSHALAEGWLASPDEELDFARVYGRSEKMDQPYDTRREQRAMDLLRGKAGAVAPDDLFVVLRDRYEGTEHYTPPQQQPVWREDLDQDPSLSRTISTNLTQSTFVAHLRGDLPVSVGAVMWLGLATPSYAGYFPLYAGGVAARGGKRKSSIPEEFSSSAPEETGDSAWWLFRRLQRTADRDYARAYPAIHSFWSSQYAVILERKRRTEARALALLEAGEQDEAARLLSAFTFSQADNTLYHGRRLLQLLESQLLESPATSTPISDQQAAATTADLVITGGRVYTFSWGEPAADGTPAADAPRSPGQAGHGQAGHGGWYPDAEAVAIKDGEILFVGSAEDARAHVGPDTEVLDVGGATVLPGLVDSHTHVAGLGELEARINLIGVETEEQAVAMVAERARSTPAGEWILGRGWDEGAWANRYPTMELLSETVPGHPVVLESLHGFAVWGNRQAFEAAGITSDTEAPAGGEILRDADGSPSGIVLNRAGSLLTGAVPVPTAEQFKGFILAGLRQMARDGFVAIHQAGSRRRHIDALESLAAAGELPIRVYAMLSARDGDLCREWLANGPISGLDGSMLAVRSVKAYYDAALGSRGARLLADYSDLPGHRGTSGDEYGFDQDLVAQMMKGGFQVGIHAIGDAGNRETLEFLESVASEDPDIRHQRHRIEHAQVIHPDDFSRFAPIDVIASMEPPHAVEDKTWAEDRLGPERIKGAYAWRTLRRAGARLTFNSDLSGSDHRIFYGLHAAITRRDKQRRPAGGWYPEQNMTPEEAIRGYTTWSAYAAHWEEQTGILAPGRWADLTVIDIDPLVLGETDPGAILDGEIVATIVAGQIVYRAAKGQTAGEGLPAALGAGLGSISVILGARRSTIGAATRRIDDLGTL